MFFILSNSAQNKIKILLIGLELEINFNKITIKKLNKYFVTEYLINIHEYILYKLKQYF